jgi:DNA-3-methyladenine glycosylase I
MKEKTLTRCPWGPGGDELMQRYHDEEWGVPVHDDNTHFEFLILEMFQAGLSWLTVLRKRDAFRLAFASFDPKRVAKFGQANVARLLNDTGIIRNRLKIEVAVNNAKKFLEVQKEFGSFDKCIWDFVDGKPVVNTWKDISEIPPRTELSDRVSADLKKRGFKFVGSTIMYAHLQATGLVNDHVINCFRYREVGEEKEPNPKH